MKPFRLRVPLYLQLLVWFFLNLMLLGLAAFFFATSNLGLTLDALLESRLGRPFEDLVDQVRAEMAGQGTAEWSTALKRISGEVGVQVLLYDERGAPIAGDTLPLPTKVMERLRHLPRPNPPGGPMPFLGRRESRESPGLPGNLLSEGVDRPDIGPPHGQFPPPPLVDGDRRAGGKRGGPRFMVRVGNPARYWAGIRIPLMGSDLLRRPVVLLVVSETISGGGALLDINQLWLVGAAIGLSALLWIPFVYRITHAVGVIDRAAGRIAEGEFDIQLHNRWGDELDRLATSINHLAARIKGFVMGQKRFLGDIAHELCTPLARMEMALSILEQRADPRQLDYIHDVKEEVQVMSALVNELLAFSKAGLQTSRVVLVPVNLRRVVDAAALRASTPSANIDIAIPTDIEVQGHSDILGRALGNVIRNAVRYAGTAGPIRIEVELSSSEEVTVWVRDQGPGVPEDSLAQLGEPFYRPESARTREGGGVGLGLAIVKTCVAACGGRVEIRNRVPKGLEVGLKFRRSPTAPPGKMVSDSV